MCIIGDAMSSKEVTLWIIIMTVDVQNQGNIGLDVYYSVSLVRGFRGGVIVFWHCSMRKGISRWRGGENNEDKWDRIGFLE